MSWGNFVKIVAAVVGTAITTGTAMHFWNKDKVSEAEKRGEKKGAAKEKAQSEDIRQRANARYEDISAKMAETNAMFNLMLALASVGYSCAASNGQMTTEEKLQIDEFIMGVSKDTLPSHIRAQMERTASNPPDIRTAHAHAVSTATPDTWHLFDEIIELIMRIDEVTPAEKATFASEWHYLRKVA